MRKMSPRGAKFRHFRLIKTSLGLILLIALDRVFNLALLKDDFFEFIRLVNFALSLPPS